MFKRADCREQVARVCIYLFNLISSLLFLPLCFLNLVGSQASRLLMRGGVVSLGSDWDCDEVPCLDALPLNRTLHIRLSTFTYSSFIFKTSFVRIDPMSASGTLKKGRLSCSLRSCSFSDRACAMKLTCLPAWPPILGVAVCPESCSEGGMLVLCYLSVSYDVLVRDVWHALTLGCKMQNTPANVTNCYVLYSSAAILWNLTFVFYLVAFLCFFGGVLVLLLSMVTRAMVTMVMTAVARPSDDGFARASAMQEGTQRQLRWTPPVNTTESKTNKFDNESVVVTSLWLFVIFVVHAINIFSSAIDTSWNNLNTGCIS